MYQVCIYLHCTLLNTMTLSHPSQWWRLGKSTDWKYLIVPDRYLRLFKQDQRVLISLNMYLVLGTHQRGNKQLDIRQDLHLTRRSKDFIEIKLCNRSIPEYPALGTVL